MYPSATYRLQLNHQFTFKEAASIIKYLGRLGVTTIYASPIFAAVHHSLHGYDVTDPSLINPEIGNERQLKDIRALLKENGMSWLQDIVPNHMAFDQANARLMDVLERGQSSEYADFFDINWNHPDPELNGKIIVPFLGDPLEHCVANGEVSLFFGDAGFVMLYGENSWPVSVSAYELLLANLNDASAFSGSKAAHQLGKLREYALSGISKTEWQTIKEEWLINVSSQPAIMKAIHEQVGYINSKTTLLKEILDDQFYLLAHWRTTEKKINYRRFFTVNGLICLRMEKEKVFREYHNYLQSLFAKGFVQGLRIDHIDGLYDPVEYVARLRQLTGEETYIIAEKILASNEELKSDWAMQGTTGYEFLSQVNRVLTDVEGAQQLLDYYKNNIAGQKNYREIIFEKKLFILLTYMRGELVNLVDYLLELKLFNGTETERERMLQALAIFMAAFPVYRIYPDAFPLDQLNFPEQAFQKALQKKPELKHELEWIWSLFQLQTRSIAERSAELLFLKRLMQFTGPLAAKGVEDTAFYFYNPLISHNEVGDEPGKLAITTKAFHRQMMNRQTKSPFALNATATHDTKRGEDARIRINVLSELSDEWQQAVQEWMSINVELKINVEGKLAPTPNEEYFIYQSMIGGFPPGLQPTEQDVLRLKEYVRKFLREEKMHTDWTEPDETYEEACFSFIDALFRNENKFLRLFITFLRKIIACASVYSIAQALIKITAPGVPDFYQGAELWDFSYVDPDNRRPVDFQLRMQMLDCIIKNENDFQKLKSYLSAGGQSGIEKLFVIYSALQVRKKYPELFHIGEYHPLEPISHEETILAFARNWKDQWAITIIPLQIAGRIKQDGTFASTECLRTLELMLPTAAPRKWKNMLTKETYEWDGFIPVSQALAEFPVSLLLSC